MGKADVKKDYYADLELDPSADQDEIKKQFKKLARLYHPDRNPGHEVEFVPKFQAVQQAHEILSDVIEKQKYDIGRTKLARQKTTAANSDQDPYTFRKPAESRAPPPSQDATYAYPPPPKSTPKQRPAYPVPPSTPNMPPPSSTSADKFNAFTRRAPPPQTWDRSKYENAARADAARAWSSMRSGPSTASGPPPPPPPPPPQMPQRPPRQHPTAARTGVDAPSPDHSNVPPPGFPGLSRTASGRKGFAPGTATSDEPMAPRTSAYAYVRGERPHATTAQTYSAGEKSRQTPATAYAMPPESPLRHARSTEQNMSDRPGMPRSSSRYTGKGGERTNLTGSGITRSASFRGLPTERAWEDRGPFGRPVSGYGPQASQYHNTSPKEPRRRKDNYYSSTDPTSSEEEVEVRIRPKAAPRQTTRPRGHTHDGRSNSNDPALTGYYPQTNYTRIVNDGTHAYPPQDNTRKPFPNMTSPDEERFSRSPDSASRYAHKEDGSVPANATSPTPSGKDHSNGNHEGKFFSDHWHAKLDDAQDMFRPTDSQRRRSPTKSLRPDARPNTRPRGYSRGDDSEQPYTPHRNSDTSVPTTNDIQFERPKSQAEYSHTNDRERGVDERDLRRHHSRESDAMDVDDDDGLSKHYSHTNGIHGKDGIDMSDFAKQAPFAAATTERLDMNDLANNLPFDSKPSDGVHLERTHSATLRALNLPKPPKTIVPPSNERLTRENWLQYAANMAAYMQDWNSFNDKMIEHFRHRQEQVTHHMSKNWIGMLGDGPSADDVDSFDGLQAGYAAYVTWLDDDARCRTWWDKANDLHRQCLEDLGDARHRAKLQFARDKS